MYILNSKVCRWISAGGTGEGKSAEYRSTGVEYERDKWPADWFWVDVR